MKTFTFSLVAASEEFLRFDSRMISLPAVTGQLGVMADHLPIMALVGLGLVHIVASDNSEHWYGVTGGFFEMMGDHATILADEIITPAEAVMRDHMKGKTLVFLEDYPGGQTQKSDLTRALLWNKLQEVQGQRA